MAAGEAHASVPQDRDPGLQAERTVLAWNRTALAVLVNGLVALRTGWAEGHSVITLWALALLLAAAATFAHGQWRARRLLAAGPQAPAPPAAAIFAVTALALMACAVALSSLGWP
jgi:uncharacterized membrane protein YidH (DUF202 family)